MFTKSTFGIGGRGSIITDQGYQTFPRARKFSQSGVSNSVTDAPRFKYRGFFADGARHFLSLPILRRVVEGLSAAKLNKLHWHLADDQAFPLVLPSLPNLSKLGAFWPAERYSPWEVAAFIEFAASRGVASNAAVLALPTLAEYPRLRPRRRRDP